MFYLWNLINDRVKQAIRFILDKRSDSLKMKVREKLNVK